ncbi:MAG: OpgC domain-containing protein [Pseudomonadota bacterium]
MALEAKQASGGSAPSVPPKRIRDPRLDFFRGIAMFIIMISHIPGNGWGRWIPGRFGYSDATEIFVFCSGMASAIAFGATFRRAGWFMGTARTLFRIWQVYWAHICLFFFLAMSLALIDSFGNGDVSFVRRLNLHHFFDRDTSAQLVGLFTLTYVPNYFDILPMYLVILALMPIFILLARVDVRLVFAVSIGLWLLANLGYLKLPAEPWSDRQWFFNPFGWQLIFFTGFALMIGWLPKPPVNRTLIWIAVAYLVLTLPLSSPHAVNFLEVTWPAAAQAAMEIYPEMRPLRSKTSFGILRYLHFLSLAYVAWVLVGEGGRRLIASRDGILGRIWARALAAIITVGQQSLAIFVFSMVLSQYLGILLLYLGRVSPYIAFVNILGIALVIGVAYFVAWVKMHPWRTKKVVHVHAHEHEGRRSEGASPAVANT